MPWWRGHGVRCQRHLTLETNHRMTPAIALYESVGFQHVPRHLWKPSEYERSDVRMEMRLD